jgi:hypothetical protein
VIVKIEYGWIHKWLIFGVRGLGIGSLFFSVVRVVDTGQGEGEVRSGTRSGV